MFLVQVLTQQWMGRSGWAHKNSLSKILHFFFQFALTPIFACGHLFRQLMTCLLCGMKSRPAQWILNFLDSCYIFNSLDSPIHRCISHLSSSALILFCLMLEVFREDPDRCHKNDFNGLYPARIALIAMIGACIFKEFEDFMQVKSVRIFFKYEFWRMFRLVNHLTIILAIIIQVTKIITTIIIVTRTTIIINRLIILQAHLEFRMVTTSNPSDYVEEKKLSDSMVAVATTISFLHILYWIQLHNTMGPIVISLSKVVHHAPLFRVIFSTTGALVVTTVNGSTFQYFFGRNS